MDNRAMGILLAQCTEPKAVEASVSYLTEQLRQFLLPKESVLICFRDGGYGSIRYLMEQAALRCGAVPLPPDGDFRWIHLLRLAFSSHAGCIVGPPLVLLGLAKVAKAKHTPLFVRNAVLAGYPCLDWMREGIEVGLDCKVWGCMSMGQSSVICGFSCPYHSGVHLRQDAYAVQIVDDEGVPLPPGAEGRIRICAKASPEIGVVLPDTGIYEPRACMCGRTAPRLSRVFPGEELDQGLLELGQMLQSWMSILDCRLEKGPHGLEMEIVYFDGERLPKLPNAAKLVLRPWNPETDEPLWYFPLEMR